MTKVVYFAHNVLVCGAEARPLLRDQDPMITLLIWPYCCTRDECQWRLMDFCYVQITGGRCSITDTG